MIKNIYILKTTVLTLVGLVLSISTSAQESSPLMIVGEGVCCGWSASSSPVMIVDEDNPSIYHYTGWIEANKEFKFITHTDWSGDQYLNPNASDPYILGNAQLQKNGDDNKFKVRESGNYDITVNIEALTVNVSKSAYQTKPIYYNILFLVGGNTPGGWSLNDATPLMQSSNNPFFFSTTVHLTSDGSFKVAVNCYADFAQKFYFRDESDSGKVSEDSTGDRQWTVGEDGDYDISLNLDAMTISIVKHTGTGINYVNTSRAGGKHQYTMSGIRINGNYKGVVIENGKKILYK